MPKRRTLSDERLTDWRILSVLLGFSCFAWSFTKNVKDFLKKFKDFFRKLLHVFRCANMADGCSCVVPASATASFLFFLKKIFFTLLFFSLLCKRVILIISWLRRCSSVLIHFYFTFTSLFSLFYRFFLFDQFVQEISLNGRYGMGLSMLLDRFSWGIHFIFVSLHHF